VNPGRAIAYAASRRRRFVSELGAFLRIPSVSNQPQHALDVRRCAAWLADHLRRVGLERVRVVPAKLHPIVYAAWQNAPQRPTLLIYGHYDVQPVEPAEAWRIPPFQPVVRDGVLYGRGACDDKGQLFAHVKAMESWLRTAHALPVNVHCIFEGAEEAGGSPGLEGFVRRNRAALRADAAVMSDTRMLGPGRPALGYSQRGTVRFELEVRGPRHDLHSGEFGGAVHNPIQALCEMLSTLHDENGRIAIPGIYDQVRAISDAERAFMAETGPKDAEILHNAGVARPWGEEGFSLYERTTIRPSLSIHGIVGGYQGSGIKTVIPAQVLAKLSVRTVPGQEAREVERLLREHVARVTPPTLTAELRTTGVSEPIRIDRRHPALRAASFAYRKSFGAAPVFVRSGGSVPAAAIFRRQLGIPTVLMGFGLPGDNMHAPNEKFELDNFYRGIETSIWNLAAAATLGPALRRARPQKAETQ
jgi:acetylornithine deacetylase/succinyl-diaminopimelate desuccinylase-like protein